MMTCEQTSFFDDHEALTFHPLQTAPNLPPEVLPEMRPGPISATPTPQVEVTKDTNPKDAVGVRKAPMSNVPPTVLAEVGVAMLEGACKYGRYNWRVAGVRASVYYDATMRHLYDWWEGTDIDPASGMHHVTKAIAGLLVLRDAMIQGMCQDDRPPSSAPFYDALNAKAAENIDRYAHLSPKHNTISDTQDTTNRVR